MVFTKFKAEQVDHPHPSQKSSLLMGGKVFNGFTPIFRVDVILKYFRPRIISFG